MLILTSTLFGTYLLVNTNILLGYPARSSNLTPEQTQQNRLEGVLSSSLGDFTCWIVGTPSRRFKSVLFLCNTPNLLLTS